MRTDVDGSERIGGLQPTVNEALIARSDAPSTVTGAASLRIRIPASQPAFARASRELRLGRRRLRRVDVPRSELTDRRRLSRRSGVAAKADLFSSPAISTRELTITRRLSRRLVHRSAHREVEATPKSASGAAGVAKADHFTVSALRNRELTAGTATCRGAPFTIRPDRAAVCLAHFMRRWV